MGMGEIFPGIHNLMKSWKGERRIVLFMRVGVRCARACGLESVCGEAVCVVSVIVVLKYWHRMCVCVCVRACVCP